MARCLMELDRLATEAQRVAFLHDHVLLRDTGRRCTASTRTAARLLDHLPVFFNGDDSRTRDFLNLGCTTEMVEMSVTQNNVFDGFRIDTDLPDIADDIVDVRLLGGIEENAAFRRRQQPDRDVAGSDIIKVIEYFERFDLLELNVIGTSDPIGFAWRF